MKMREIAQSLIGGCIVYVAMATFSACGQGSSGSTSGNTGAGGAHCTGGSSGSGGDDGGIWDAFTDPVPDATAGPTSGSRLKVKYRIADDGAKAAVPTFWYDSQLDSDCSFQVGADGKERCLPLTSESARVEQFFGDASCTERIAYTYMGCQVTYAYRYESDPAACVFKNLPTHVYPVGAVITPATVYFRDDNDVCTGGGPNPSYVYYTFGAEIPPSSFVAGSVIHD
jgi:hypothetical protein